MCIGVGVGRQRRCKACQTLRERDNQGTVFVVVFVFVWWSPGWLSSKIILCRVENPKLRARRMIASRSVNMVRHPRGSYIVIPITVSGVATPENKV